MWGSAAVPKKSAIISDTKFSLFHRLSTLNFTPGFISSVPVTVFG